MAKAYTTPGVYIEEKNTFPSSMIAVATDVPVFIGYTAKAISNGNPVLRQPVRITSLAEYMAYFGAGFKPSYTIADATDADKDTFIMDGKRKLLNIVDNHTFYLYNSIRLFYANGGGAAYILSVGTYGDKPEGIAINAADIVSAIDVLKREQEPTLVVIPDAIALGEACYNQIYTAVLQHCAETQSRFGIFDLVKQPATVSTEQIVAAFRDQIGNNGLNYGAAYYPWLKTTVIQPDEISFENIDAGVDLAKLLPEGAAREIITQFKATAQPTEGDKRNFHLSLKAASITYVKLLNELLNRENVLPPSGAMAGIYTMVDKTRGVWKAPANVSLNMVSAPAINISNDEQEQLNVDALSGKSINVIRSFVGMGTLVWGARTLDGNSQDWRYINVRRTMIMLEESIKLGCRVYVFEPNNENTWVTVKTMIVNFLTGLWKQGALAGAAPQEAFDVQIGLGTTMTPTDILDGYIRITVKVAIARPAEFIVITFQQQMQQS